MKFTSSSNYSLRERVYTQGKNLTIKTVSDSKRNYSCGTNPSCHTAEYEITGVGTVIQKSESRTGSPKFKLVKFLPNGKISTKHIDLQEFNRLNNFEEI